MIAVGAVADPTKSARWIEALGQQSNIITSIFARAGFEPVQPAVIQPAAIFLDLIGEDLRARTYVFTDPDGRELCLRPDLTIPTSQLYLDRCGDTGEPARYSYNGTVFRYQRDDANLARPREFRQAGIEYFAPPAPPQAEAEILALTVESIRASGLRAFNVRVGDLAIFDALLEAIDMPSRWREQLRHHLRHPGAFRRQLQKLMRPEEFGRALAEPLFQAIQAARRGSIRHGDAVAALEQHLEARGLAVVGTRTLDEIAWQLEGLAADLKSPPLDPRAALLLDAYIKLNAPAKEVSASVRALLKGTAIDIDPALASFDERLRLAAQEGIDISDAPFAGGFGRQFEYYTGFVFEVLSPVIEIEAPIAGGGRYDRLVEAISGGRAIAAVGSAIHSERLLLAVRGGRP
ncbi:MAG: ATP phosphoribosyltransferase regulatory subunit [Hyphomicrobiaceae bacterium]|nr:ATP phosphoribosyltransferase regulatory subunit [Hyphomicrobiaceae bacterium]